MSPPVRRSTHDATSRLRGVVPVLAVPFTEGGALDLDGFDRVVEHQLGCGVSAVMLFGIASEYAKLTDAERGSLQASLLTRTAARPDVAAIVSVTAHCTEIAVADAVAAVEAGADALNVLPPHLFSPRPDTLVAHLRAVLAAVDVPVMVQYAPAQTGTVLDAATLVALSRHHGNLVAVKVESVPPGRMVTALVDEHPPMRSLVGYAGVSMLDALDRGAVGVMPGSSFPELYVQVYRHWADGELQEARRLHARMLPYLSSWMTHVELVVQVEKTILLRRGIITSDRCRAPGWALDGPEMTLVEAFLDEFADLLPAPTGPVA